MRTTPGCSELGKLRSVPCLHAVVFRDLHRVQDVRQLAVAVGLEAVEAGIKHGIGPLEAVQVLEVQLGPFVRQTGHINDPAAWGTLQVRHLRLWIDLRAVL